MNIQGNMTNSPVTSVNSKTGAVNLNASDVGARPNTWMPNLQAVAFLGENPIKTTANDTTANWANIGSGFAWYSTAGLLNNQPGQWGFVVNYVNGSDVFQIWNTQSNGPTYMRSGNANGWGRSWTELIDSANIGNYVPHFQVGTYTGNGDAVQTINLPFTPIAVFVTTVDGIYFRESDPLVNINDRIQTWYGGFAIKNSPLQVSKSSSSSAVYTILNVRKNGFDVSYGFGEGNINGKTVTYDFRLNANGQVRKYIALG